MDNSNTRIICPSCATNIHKEKAFIKKAEKGRDRQMISMKEKYENFIKKIDHAEKILEIIELRELLTPFHRLRKDSILHELRPIPRMRSLVDQTIEVALPLLLVYSVSCLEHFLSTSAPNKPYLSTMIRKHASKVDRELTQKAHEIRIKRNIVIHSYEQRVDQQALKELNENQITGYKLDEILRLTPEIIKADLNSLREFAEKVAFS